MALFLMGQVDRDVLPLRVALQHTFEGELAADAAFFVAAVGVTGALAEALVDLDPSGFDHFEDYPRPAKAFSGLPNRQRLYERSKPGGMCPTRR
jgi:hypothetical protein